jgi:hypothetical protein
MGSAARRGPRHSILLAKAPHQRTQGRQTRPPAAAAPAEAPPPAPPRKVCALSSTSTQLIPAMAAKAPPLLFAWLAAALLAVAAVVLLAGVSAAQNTCAAASADRLTTSAAAGFFGRVPCDMFYRYPVSSVRAPGRPVEAESSLETDQPTNQPTDPSLIADHCPKMKFQWWITWYTIALALAVPAVLAAGAVHRWRYGLAGALAVLAYLLCQAANSFFLQRMLVPAEQAAPRTALAGAIMGSIAAFSLIILAGVRDERARPARAA